MHSRAILLGSVLTLVLVLAAMAVGLVPADPPEPSMTTDGLPILVAPPRPRSRMPVTPCPQEGFEGTLRRDAATGLTIDDATVAWPHDYSAILDGGVAVLLDARGAPVAREGDVVRVDGRIGAGGQFRVCGTPTVLEPASPAAGVAAPTPPSECPVALLEGALVADAHEGLAVRGETGEVTAVRWPPVFEVRVQGAAAALLDGDGYEVARTGDRISAGGGMSAAGDEWIICPWEVVRAGTR
jgi:hypothetical protein